MTDQEFKADAENYLKNVALGHGIDEQQLIDIHGPLLRTLLKMNWARGNANGYKEGSDDAVRIMKEHYGKR